MSKRPHVLNLLLDNLRMTVRPQPKVTKMATVEQRLFAARKELLKAREVIVTGENRAMAIDGPTGHCRSQLSDGEFDMMWAYVEKARRLLTD